MDADDFEYNVHTGAFVFIDVTPAAELNIDALYVGPTISLGGDLQDIPIQVQFTNNEEYDLDDVVLKLRTSSADPFENAIDSTQGWSEEVEIANFNSGASITRTFRVNIRDGAQAGIYELPVNLIGVKETLREDVIGNLSVRITVNPIPAYIMISSVISDPRDRARRTFRLDNYSHESWG